MQLLLLEALQNTVSDWSVVTGEHMWCMYIVEGRGTFRVCVYLFAAGGRSQ